MALGEAFVRDGEWDAARVLFEGVLTVAPGEARAHFGLKLLCEAAGDSDGALRHEQLAFARADVIAIPYEGAGAPIDMLIVVAANGGNVVTGPLVDRAIVRGYSVTAEGYDPAMTLPPHHLVLNGVGDVDRSPAALACVERLLSATTAPVINRPADVRATGRREIAERLARLEGVVTAHTVMLPRGSVTADELRRRGFTFPLLLRTPGFHTGEYFEYLTDPGGIAAALDRLPGDAVFAIAYVDVRDADGSFRKYRVLSIGGRLYPLHLAIASQWKVHYFSADMAERADHRAEEARFLDDMAAVLGPRALAALERIAAALNLDYGGIDFAIDRNGDVAVFEANATMVILPAGDDPRFGYRAPAIARAQAAVRDLIRTKAELGGYRPD